MSQDDQNQTERTLEAIRQCYSTWGESYHRDYYGEGAPYPPVQIDIVKRELTAVGARMVLDAGCGPASMLRELFELDLELHGFDLTPEMIEVAKRTYRENGLDDAKVWLGNALEADDHRRAELSPEDGYDAALSFGVTPHIPAAADETLIANLRDSVRPGGLVLAEARNGLFSLFTMNRYSHEFFMNELIDTAALRGQAGSETAALDDALGELEGMFRTDIPPIRKGKDGEPGYDEVVSRTHNPIVLKSQFEAAGLVDVRVLFYHFHSLPPMFGGKAPDLFIKSSVAMESDPEDWRGHFMASAFIISAKRPK